MARNSATFPTRPDITPTIYAYEEPNVYPGLLKVGYTERTPEVRIAEQHVQQPDGQKSWNIVFRASAMRPDGSTFMDHDLHKWLRKHGYVNKGGEWFRCSVDNVRAAWQAVYSRTENDEQRTEDFGMRPEQRRAVEKTKYYFDNFDYNNGSQRPKFLWNCKMRFGKTFATYELAKAMGLKRVLVLTFKPAVESAWHDDLLSHVDFEGWQFISRGGLTYEAADKSKPIVCFGSFQDYLGYDKKTQSIKPRNRWVHEETWDLVVFDEYHYGAWRDKAKGLFSNKDQEEAEYDEDPEKIVKEDYDSYDETWLPITANRYLFLSGTPFRALNDGEFIEEQIFSWTYTDEQRAKQEWVGNSNPYESLPRMVMMVYQLPNEIERIAKAGEFDEFDLNSFFKADGEYNDAQFVHKDDVQKWLDLIRGQYLPASIDDLKLGRGKPKMPFADSDLLGSLQHTLWFLPNVASCYAMKNLLSEQQNTFYRDYNIVVCAGNKVGMGAAAKEPVDKAMNPSPLESKSITLTCGKLTTGVTVKPWGGIFMLRNLKTPETYFQSAFRVQSPWTVKNDNGHNIIMKQECYVFDFAINRALRQISDYSRSLDIKETNPEKKVAEFMSFLPVIAYKDGVMAPINASEVLDMAMSGTTATLLAKRWESALLVNVDNTVLNRLINNEEAMRALSHIEGFRNLNNDIQTIIAKSESVKEKKKSDRELTSTEKHELTEEEKEYKSKRKEIQEKLLKFAARIPIFMYLTDFRENSLKDVIQKLEPKLFKKVTGLETKDFDLLLSLGLFNEARMNDAVYGFRRYEESSLDYSGINKHAGENVGGFAGSLSREEYEQMYNLQQSSIREPLSSNVFMGALNDTHSNSDNSTARTGTPASYMPVEAASDAASDEQTSSNQQLSNNLWAQKLSHARQINTQQPPSTNNNAEDINVTIGDTVHHRAFGAGSVVSINDGLIEIRFTAGIKKFHYPAAFKQGFLSTIAE